MREGERLELFHNDVVVKCFRPKPLIFLLTSLNVFKSFGGVHIPSRAEESIDLPKVVEGVTTEL